MTPNEFKAWFDGFTEAFTGCPTKAQWSRIKSRVAEIDGKPTSYPIYVDRYWSQPRPYWQYLGTTCAGSLTTTGGASSSYSASGVPQQLAYNSADAMYTLGKADAQSFAA